MKKVGLLGGSFDPVHLGHVGIAREALKQLSLNEVWFILANDPNLKDPLVADFLARYDMLKIALATNQEFKICDIEKSLPTPSYTINTVIELKRLNPEIDFYFLIGSDQANQLDKWHRIAELKELVTFKIITRGDSNEGDVVIPLDTYPQSSSGFRSGKVEYLDAKVWQYIVKQELYLEGIVKNQMKEKRFIHTLNVVDTALALARTHQVDRHKTYLAALFHDIAKEMPKSEMVKYLTLEEKLTDEEIWHQFVGARLVRDYYQINDEEIYQAIASHTTGDCDSKLAKIIYCADKIEPGRKYDTKPFFVECLSDLDAGFELIKASCLEYISKEKL